MVCPGRPISPLREQDPHQPRAVRQGWDKTTESSPVAGHRKNILGVTAGFGGQLIDPVGIRVIPEVRYTRWFGATFDSPPTLSRRDQLEFMISISF